MRNSKIAFVHPRHDGSAGNGPGDGNSEQPPNRVDPLPSPVAPATYFASPVRSSPDELRNELKYIQEDPAVDALLRATSGLVAIVNEHRQVLALNTHMLELLGVNDPAMILGLRLGETVGCVHAGKGPAGCGTTEYCSSCGSAIAQVTSLATGNAVERTCAIDLRHPFNQSEQICLRVLACPFQRGERRMLMLFLQDISETQHHLSLNRTFFHDVRNSVSAILTAGEMLSQTTQGPDAGLATTLVQMTRRLAREIDLQRCLTTMSLRGFEKMPAVIDPAALLEEATRSYTHLPEAAGRTLEIVATAHPGPLIADVTLVLRVLQNMVVNALEATPPEGLIRLWVQGTSDEVEFSVWNQAAIPSDIARRIFQRNFSTKSALGRGLGTYSMKLLGEHLLGGRVSFTSDAAHGTCFHFTLPRRPTVDVPPARG